MAFFTEHEHRTDFDVSCLVMRGYAEVQWPCMSKFRCITGDNWQCSSPYICHTWATCGSCPVVVYRYEVLEVVFPRVWIGLSLSCKYPQLKKSCASVTKVIWNWWKMWLQGSMSVVL